MKKKPWLRWYRDTVLDAKFRLVRLRASDLAWPERGDHSELVVGISDVVASWALILECVTDDNGTVKPNSPLPLDEYLSAALDIGSLHAECIIQAMTEYLLLMKEGESIRVAKWQYRQYLDASNSERQSRFRNNKKCNGAVTKRNGKITHRQRTENREHKTENRDTEKEKKKDNGGASAPTVVNALSEVLDEEHTEAIIAHRRAIKAPLTLRAAQLLAKDLASMGNANDNADTMIRKGWRGFDAKWLNGRGSSPPLAAKRSPYMEAAKELFEEMQANEGKPNNLLAHRRN